MGLLAASRAPSQQSLFNVPSGEVTPKGGVFFQQQVTGTESGLQANSVLCYGLAKNIEIGVDLLNVVVPMKAGPVVAASMLLALDVLHEWRVAGGAIAGTTVGGRGGGRF